MLKTNKFLLWYKGYAYFVFVTRHNFKGSSNCEICLFVTHLFGSDESQTMTREQWVIQNDIEAGIKSIGEQMGKFTCTDIWTDVIELSTEELYPILEDMIGDNQKTRTVKWGY